MCVKDKEEGIEFELFERIFARQHKWDELTKQVIIKYKYNIYLSGSSKLTKNVEVHV